MTATHLYSTRDQALQAHTALCLGRSDLLSLAVQAGDSLRGERGTVWITVDGQPQDILLEPGQAHVVQTPGALNVSALHSGCVSVRSASPLAWRRVSPQDGPAWAGQARRWLGAVLSNVASAGASAGASARSVAASTICRLAASTAGR